VTSTSSLCLAGVDLVAGVEESGLGLIVVLKALTDMGRFHGQPELELRRGWSAEEAHA